MRLQLQLEIQKTELRIQENPLCTVRLANVGDEAVTVPNWALSEVYPQLQVANLRTGEEDRRVLVKRSVLPELEVVLKAGEHTEARFSLLDRAFLDSPGEYEVSAVYPHRDRCFASPPVVVRIQGSTAKSLMMDTLQGVVSYGAWVDVGTRPPHIMRTRFDFSPGGGIRETVGVAPATFHSKPVISLPSNQKGRQAHWIAWIEDRKFRFVHIGNDRIVGKVQELAWVAPDSTIVPFLFSDPVGRGQMVLWSASPGGAQYQVMELASEGAKPGPILERGSVEALWSRSYTGSNGSHYVTLLEHGSAGLTLSTAKWSSLEFREPTPLASWTGGFVSGEATLNLEEKLHGAFLIWEEEGNGGLRLHQWTLGANGSLEQGSKELVRWDESNLIRSARVRVNARGEPALLLCDADGDWYLHFRGAFGAVPESIRKTKFPLDLGFTAGGSPVLVAAEKEKGFRMMTVDGASFPKGR